MFSQLKEAGWDLLLRRIRDGRCTPFLGAGACSDVLPLGSDIAREWAGKYKYPLKDSNDLARVAQFLAVDTGEPIFPKRLILEKLFENNKDPDFKDPNEPHRLLADLPLPIYMTTNYDDFMVQALKSRNRKPVREMCRWNEDLRGQPSAFDRGFRPTEKKPVVFHLHGHNEAPESLVLTEDDYLEFLVSVSRDPMLLPPRIQEALTGASLLFIGYSLKDWDFRVLFRGLVASMPSSYRRISVTVQLPPGSAEAQEYLERYFNKMDVQVYWGKAKEFSAELRKRWEEFSND